jgi:hypothetical protein
MLELTATYPPKTMTADGVRGREGDSLAARAQELAPSPTQR